jgi:hypothetical protein
MDELNHPGAQELLRAQPLARLAYTGLDGLPRVIPIGFCCAGERIWVGTAPNAPKVRALAARPQVALTIDRETPPNCALLVRGLATIEVVDGVPGEYREAASRAVDDARYREFETQVRSVHERMAWISIEPRWARYYDFVDRVPAFLLRLTAESHDPGELCTLPRA